MSVIAFITHLPVPVPVPVYAHSAYVVSEVKVLLHWLKANPALQVELGRSLNGSIHVFSCMQEQDYMG